MFQDKEKYTTRNLKGKCAPTWLVLKFSQSSQCPAAGFNFIHLSISYSILFCKNVSFSGKQKTAFEYLTQAVVLHRRETLIFTEVACLLPTVEKMQTIALTKKNVFRLQFQAFREASICDRLFLMIHSILQINHRRIVHNGWTYVTAGLKLFDYFSYRNWLPYEMHENRIYNKTTISHRNNCFVVSAFQSCHQINSTFVSFHLWNDISTARPYYFFVIFFCTTGIAGSYKASII